MLYSTRIADGVRIGGFLDSPAQVFVTWKSEDGQKHGELIETSEPGLFFCDLAMKGEVVGLEALPVTKAKASKESVDYSKGMNSSHCGVCDHFEPPHACAKVAGHIDVDMWCRLFKRTTSTKAEERDSPPKGYPKDKSEYAVPDEYRFPIDGKHIHAAISYFPKHKFKSPAQKRSAAKRILSAAKKHGVHVGDDDAVARAAHGG